MLPVHDMINDSARQITHAYHEMGISIYSMDTHSSDIWHLIGLQ